MKNLILRTIFGAIYVALIVLSIVLGNETFFSGLFLFFLVLAIFEFYRINKADNILKYGGLILSVYVYLISGIMLFNIVDNSASLMPFATYTTASAFLLLVVSEIFKPDTNPVTNWGLLLFQLCWILLPFLCMLSMVSGTVDSRKYLLFAFIIVWINDTGAYCVGSLLGKHKMIPRISPAKSWEGLAGGLCFSILAGVLLLNSPIGFISEPLPIWKTLILTVCIVLAATLGDLMESLVKRTVGVKDSGNIMPGHGGMLDRLDSMLLAAPVSMLILHILHII